MRKYDRISALFWFFVGIYVTREGYVVYVGPLREPGPGFLLFWCGIVLCGLSAFTFVKAQFSIEQESKKMWVGLKWHRPLLVLMICLVYTFFFERLGYLLSTFLWMLILFKLMDSIKWPKALLASFLSVFFTWLIFAFGLRSQFPKGFLEGFLKKYLFMS
jgi:putative tricarboxylic transport membrane protein